MEEFQRAYNKALAKAQVAQELITFLSSQGSRVEQLRKILEDPKKDYGI